MKTASTISNRENRAFTLAEVVVAMGCATFMLAALIAGEVTLLRTFDASDRYSASEMASERMVDHLGADLRRAVWVSGSTGVKAAVQLESPSTGTRTLFSSGSLDFVLGGSNLLITQSGYYVSNDPNMSEYRMPSNLVSLDANNIIYGTATGGSNNMVLVRYKVAYNPAYGSNCLVREDSAVAAPANYMDPLPGWRRRSALHFAGNCRKSGQPAGEHRRDRNVQRPEKASLFYDHCLVCSGLQFAGRGDCKCLSRLGRGRSNHYDRSSDDSQSAVIKQSRIWEKGRCV